jgi:hypothetical protein
MSGTTDTPRTDAYDMTVAEDAKNHDLLMYGTAVKLQMGFARQLERELAAMTAERDGYAAEVRRLTDALWDAAR